MTKEDGSRRVRLVLCGHDGDPVGALPWFVVDEPWWPEVGPVVRAARDRFGVDSVVLRLLSAETDSLVMGGSVSYVAEVDHIPPKAPIEPVDPSVLGTDSALRARWARPGGVAATIGWADAQLAALGRPRTGPAIQVKTWNLSSILRLPTAIGDVWCKSVPPFMAHEGAILALVGASDPALVPRVLAADAPSGTILLPDLSGEDGWEAPEGRLIEMARRLVKLQATWVNRVDELLRAGLPDWRSSALPDLVAALLERPEVIGQLTDEERTGLDALVAGLPRRLSDLAECGVPETLVHGDFHAGNWRSDGDDMVLIDWGDSGVGHPLLDMAAFFRQVDEPVRQHVTGAWVGAWRALYPASEPARAARLLPPVAALRQALIYRGFLDNIEASERIYHEPDVPRWLRRALEV